ncbi:MAG: YegP family protein, partial [Serratia symbiotica]|nr:YegP family protein [Serratia symbiotica]
DCLRCQGMRDLLLQLSKSSIYSIKPLKAKNHQVIGVSEMYNSESAARNGRQSVIKNGSTSDVRDLSEPIHDSI